MKPTTDREPTMDATTLTLSQIATLRHINGRPGVSEAAVGFDYAATLAAAGFITIRRGKCYPTAAAAVYGAPSADERRETRMHAHAALMGRWAAMA
jgi:hypothetical protein